MKLSVSLVTRGTGRPLFIVPSAATTSLSLMLFARSIDPPRPIYSFAFPELEDRQLMPQSIQEMGTQFVSEIKSIQPEGPFLIAGHCFGAAPAMEIVTQLEAAGESVSLLTLIEAFAVDIAADQDVGAFLSQDENLRSRDADLKTAFNNQISQIESKLGMLPIEVREHFVDVTSCHIRMAFAYSAKPIAAPIFQIRTADHPESLFKGWEQLSTCGYFERVIQGTSDSILQVPDVKVLAHELSDALSRFS